MADLRGEEGEGAPAEVAEGGNATPVPAAMVVQPSGSESLKGESGKVPKWPASLMKPSLEMEEFINLLHGSDPVKVELNRLENEVRDKERELGEAQAEIKALKLSERAREKAVEEMTEELVKVDEKLKLTESLLENRNLEIKKINDEKKQHWLPSLQQKRHLEESTQLKRMIKFPPLKPFLHP